jgi:hypothetical protein
MSSFHLGKPDVQAWGHRSQAPRSPTEGPDLALTGPPPRTTGPSTGRSSPRVFSAASRLPLFFFFFFFFRQRRWQRHVRRRYRPVCTSYGTGRRVRFPRGKPPRPQIMRRDSGLWRGDPRAPDVALHVAGYYFSPPSLFLLGRGCGREEGFFVCSPRHQAAGHGPGVQMCPCIMRPCTMPAEREERQDRLGKISFYEASAGRCYPSALQTSMERGGTSRILC